LFREWQNLGMGHYFAAYNELSKKREAVERFLPSLKAGTMTLAEFRELEGPLKEERLAGEVFLRARASKRVGIPFASLF